MLTIERVRTRAELNEFIALPRRLYDGLPGYIAPLDLDRRQMLDPSKSAFFTHGVASYWIARRDGAAVGRISAQIDFAAEGAAAADIGLFGSLDAVDDDEVVAALLRTAEAWLRQRGRRIVRGPFMLSINGEPGLMVEGQMEPPVTLLGWHPSYLARHLPVSGYRQATRLFCYLLDNFAFDDRLQELGRARARAELTVRPLRLDALPADMEQARRIFNDGWRHNWNFTPATETDVAELIKQFRPFLFRDSGFFIDIRGEPAAFVLSIPNISEITVDLGPRPSIAGWLRLAYRIWRQRYRGYRLVLIGVASKYQNSIVGKLISTVAFEEVRLRMRARQVQEVIAGWIVEQNESAIRPLLSLGFRQTRTYNLYEKILEADPSTRTF
jgi:hypothetical protein